MRRLLLGWWVVASSGCGLSACEELCTRNGGCLDEEVAAFDSSWEEWTGFADRSAYESECFAVFDDARESGARRHDLQKTCRAELSAPCEPSR